MKMKAAIIILITALLAFSFAGCSTSGQTEDDSQSSSTTTTTTAVSEDTSGDATDDSSDDTSVSSILSSVEGSMLDTSEMFTDRDLEQTADLEDASYIELSSDEDVVIGQEGVYVLSGDVENVTVIVEADDEAKVQIVLDGVNIVNEDSPAIYVKSGDKVFITTTDSDNYMEVSGTFVADGDTNLDAVIFSKSDLVLNGVGTLEILSMKGNGITSKDDLKVTGGTYDVAAYYDAFEANDSIRIYDGDFTIVANEDGLHSENDDDATLGYIYILDGTFTITVGDDAIRGNSVVQIDGGEINIETCYEGIEGTYIQINGGDIELYATDDGVNATAKSSAYDVVIEINGGTIDVTVGSGDTDGFDSNGSLYINGGTVNVSANSAFDVDRTAELNGGDVTVNGTTVTQITVSQMGGQMGGQTDGRRR